MNGWRILRMIGSLYLATRPLGFFGRLAALMVGVALVLARGC